MLVAPVVAPAPAACGARRDVALRAHDVTMTCKWGVDGCSGLAAVVIDNCSTETVELLRVVRWQNGHPAMWDFVAGTGSFALPAGTQRTFARPIWNDGPMSFQVTLVGNLKSLTAHANAVNPARDAARAACRACRGHWGNHGMTGVLGCLCRAKDAGRVCHSRCECEGGCELRGGVGPVGRCRQYAGDKGCTCPRRSRQAAFGRRARGRGFTSSRGRSERRRAARGRVR